MKRIRLFHWNTDEAQSKIRALEKAGYRVDYTNPLTPDLLRQLKTDPPDAIVIDLTRLPSHGRDVALAVRGAKATRHVPLVFVEGLPEKVTRVRKVLPDAEYTTWRRIRSSVQRALTHPPADPVVPASNLAGYSGTPLPKKLGIKPGYTVALSGAPADFATTLGELPADVVLRNQARGKADLVIWFPASRADLSRRVRQMGQRAGAGGLWIAWPKVASGRTTDLSQTVVRETGLAAELVDYKICAIDATWSALRFTRRKT